MKYALKTLAALGLVAAFALSSTSCNKTVTPRKLDGTWNVTSGSGSYRYESDSEETSATFSYDGTVMKTIGERDYIQLGYTVDIDLEETVTGSYSFERSTGACIITSVSKNTIEGESGSYYEFDENIDAYTYAGNFVKTTERTQTSTQKGFYTITGDAGEDIEPNSQIVFQKTSSAMSYVESYTYKDMLTDNVLNANSVYVREFIPGTLNVGYFKLETKDEGSTSISGSSEEAQIWNVIEIDRDEMIIEWTDERSVIDSDDSENNSFRKSSYEWILTQE